MNLTSRLGYLTRNPLGHTVKQKYLKTTTLVNLSSSLPGYTRRFNDLPQFSRFQIPKKKPWAMKRQADRGFRAKKRKVQQQPFEGTHEQVLRYEVSELLKSLGQLPNGSGEVEGNEDESDATEIQLPEKFLELELDVQRLSSTGDALAVSDKYPGHVFVVPFCLAGEKVRAKVMSTLVNDKYSTADFLEIIQPSSTRRDDLVGCKYFTKCSGCQLQMMDYDDQLNHKKGIVEQAYKAFSNLRPELVPPVGDTLPSPMQYGYRTKLTPHFDGAEMEKVDNVKKFVRPPELGFSIKGRKRVMEIEDCPIGTDVVRKGFAKERQILSKNFDKYKNGATILLRESTSRIPKVEKEDAPPEVSTEDEDYSTKELIIRSSTDKYIIEKRYVSDMNGISTEFIDDFEFKNRAGSFFQNNNSILSSFTAYVRDNAIPKSSSSSSTPAGEEEPPIKYLLDAYCGSGLFTITLSSLFTSSLGVDVDPAGILYARLNAEANNIPNTGFISADASKLFSDVPFPADQTLMVIDPPRKGCSEDFLRQLLELGPKRVVYVSCNVNTQARDIGMLVRGVVDGWKVGSGEWVSGSVLKAGHKQASKWRYEIESLRGCDFFPQTGHVEGVAFLNRVPMEEGQSS